MVFDWGFRCFSDIEGNITNKSIYAFSFLVGKHREPQSINAKLFLPIIPIGIVAYALTFFVGQPLSKQLYILLYPEDLLTFSNWCCYTLRFIYWLAILLMKAQCLRLAEFVFAVEEWLEHATSEYLHLFSYRHQDKFPRWKLHRWNLWSAQNS